MKYLSLSHACKCSEMVWICSVPIIFAFCSISVFIVLHSLLTNCPEGTHYVEVKIMTVYLISPYSRVYIFFHELSCQWLGEFSIVSSAEETLSPDTGIERCEAVTLISSNTDIFKSWIFVFMSSWRKKRFLLAKTNDNQHHNPKKKRPPLVIFENVTWV